MPFLLARYVGTGTPEDPFRPSGTDDLEGWSAIDLRPDPAVVDGAALLHTPSALPTSPARLTLTDDPDEQSTTLRRRLEDRLGLTLDDVPFRRLIRRILIAEGRDPNGPVRGTGKWKRLLPERNAYRIWLGGLLDEMPAAAGGATVSDNFNVGTGALPATWTVVTGDLLVNTNELRQGTASATPSVGRYETDLATVNQYAQIEIAAAQFVGTGVKQIGPACRFSSSDDTAYAARRRYTDSTATERMALYKRAAGAETVLGAATATGDTGLVGDVVRVEANGSTIRGLLNGVEIHSVTDSSITTGLRAGVHVASAGGNARAIGDNWEAGDLSSSTTVSGSQATTTTTAFAGTPAVSPVGTLVTETDTANTGSKQVALPGGLATSTVTAFGGTAAAVVAGSKATETDTANAGGSGGDTQVAGSQASETDTANAGALLAAVPGSLAMEADSPSVGVPVVVVFGSQATVAPFAFSGSAFVLVPGSKATETDTPFAGTSLEVGGASGANASSTVLVTAGRTSTATVATAATSTSGVSDG